MIIDLLFRKILDKFKMHGIVVVYRNMCKTDTSGIEAEGTEYESAHHKPSPVARATVSSFLVCGSMGEHTLVSGTNLGRVSVD